MTLDAMLLRRDANVFCLNEADTAPTEVGKTTQIVKFLGSYFPWPSRWETATGVEPSITKYHQTTLQ